MSTDVGFVILAVVVAVAGGALFGGFAVFIYLMEAFSVNRKRP